MVMGELAQETEVLVMGSGPGGYAAAFRAADLGLEVTMVDRAPRPGGECLFRGCIPSKTLLYLAELIHDLNKEISLSDLETLLPYSKEELNDALELLKLPDGLDRLLEEEAKKREEEMPTVVTLVFENRQRVVFERAVEQAAKEIGNVKNKKSRAVILMAEKYLDTEQGEASAV